MWYTMLVIISALVIVIKAVGVTGASLPAVLYHVLVSR